MLFRVLGPLEVEADDTRVRLPGARPRALLTALLLQPNTVVPAATLMTALWDEDLPDRAENALHQVVARLRSQLGPLAGLVVTRPPGYVLTVDPSDIDAARFVDGCRRARELASADPARAVTLFDDALALWRGPAYGEFADGFAQSLAAGLEERRVAALEDRVACLLHSGPPADAVAAARDLAALHPLRDRPVELLMRALHADGRAAVALEVYRSHRKHLADELGLDPAPALRELETRILRDELEPPPSAPVVPRAPELPWRSGALLGRERELDLLLGCVTEQRLLTLVGPGGVGKTRLALEAAHRLAGSRTVWWADLTTVTPSRVVAALATATGVELTAGVLPAAALCAALRAHKGVLCLDNAEHLLAELAPVVERLIATAPGLAVLATSRERLAIDEEHVHPLGPLPVPSGPDRDNPAVRLFVARVPGLEPATLTDDDLGVVAQLCRSLDGLPLALELGAARVPAFGLRELEARLGERLDLLGGGRRTAAARHRTLRAVVDWSYNLLDEDEARLLARLGVFPSSFELDQAKAVCADEDLPQRAVAPLLARLVDRSLVQAGRGRFGLLETLQTYARERLDPDDVARLRARHATDTARRLSELRPRLATPDEPAAVRAIAALGADLHAAWAHACANDRDLAAHMAADIFEYAYHRQRLDLLDWGRTVAEWQPERPLPPRALAAAAAAGWASGELNRAHVFASRGVDVPGGDGVGHAVNQLACLAMFEGRHEDAMALFGRAARLHRAAGELVRSLSCEISVRQAMTYAGRPAEAAAQLDPLRERAHASENPSAIAWAHYVTGEALADSDVGAALAAYAAAIGHGEKSDCRLFVMLARSSIVRLSARHADPRRAFAEFERVLDQWEDLGNQAAQWWALANLVVLLERTGRDADAALLGGAAIATRHQHFAIALDEAALRNALDRVRGRLGPAAADQALAAGAALHFAAAVDHARQVIKQ